MRRVLRSVATNLAVFWLALAVEFVPLFGLSRDAYAKTYAVASEYDGLSYDVITNCVSFAKYKVPSLPSGSTEDGSKYSVINSHTARPGAVAIYNYQHVSYVESVNGTTVVTLNGGFRETLPDGRPGNFTGHIERISGTESELGIIGYYFPGANDSTPPTISNFYIGELREGAFTILATVKDDVGVSRVRYAIWTEQNGQDDLVWQDGNCPGNNSIYWARVNFADHNDERGKYIVHAYAYDTSDNYISEGLEYTFDANPPVITDVVVSNVSAQGYTVRCRVTDEMSVIRVKFPTWTLANEQDDLLADWQTNDKASGTKNGNYYTFRVNASDHNNETGMYRTHIYAWDTLGNRSRAIVPDVDVNDISSTVDYEPPVVKSVTVVEQTDKKLVFDVEITDNVDKGSDCLVVKAADVLGEKSVSNLIGVTTQTRSDDVVRCTVDISKLGESVQATAGSRGYLCGGNTHCIAINARDKAGNSCYGSAISEWDHVQFDFPMGERAHMEVGETLAGEDIFGQSLSGWTHVKLGDDVVEMPTNNTVKAVKEGSGWLYLLNNQSGHILSAFITVGPEDADVLVSNVVLNKSSLDLLVGEKAQIAATVTPSNASNKALTWTSASPSVASVSTAGEVTAKTPGKTTVVAVASDGSGCSASCEVTVRSAGKADQTITVAKRYDKTVGDVAFALGAQLTEGDGTLSYASDSPAVATVDARGRVTVVGPGLAMITVTASETDAYRSSTATVVVYVADADDPTPPTPSGKTDIATIQARLAYTTTTYTGEELRPKVSVVGLTEDVDYWVTYLDNIDAGTATVEVEGIDKYSGIRKFTFKIVPAAQTVTVAANKSVAVGKTVNLGATTNGDGTLTYATSNAKVATVSAKGVVSGVGAGTAKITIYAAAGKNYAESTSKTVTVKVAKAANTLTAKAKKATVAAAYKTVSKKALVLATNVTVSKAQGAVSYANASTNAAAKKFKVNAKTGKITVPKKTKKGTYTIIVKVTAKGNASHNAGTKNVTFKVKVK